MLMRYFQSNFKSNACQGIVCHNILDEFRLDRSVGIDWQLLFKHPKNEVGETIKDNKAKIVNKAYCQQSIRYVNTDKMKTIKEKHQTLHNVEDLQVPKIVHFLWDQLKNQTKAIDVTREKFKPVHNTFDESNSSNQ
ncbi:hypothetical protein MAR_030164 [Mya arenaria]|uniref:Uncharacterized protein n=1 Tax=Mya arenaria TaxID=6604 RepID=A0ABY7DLS7_MYAAR|nr:hypothetical protein MAR_030164 [Mya arenaria]